MNVRLISSSTPIEGLGIANLQELIAYCARVSNPSNQHNSETSEKLLMYLLKHKHWSPFETVSACLEITSTRDIARQVLRHRSFSFQEFSQRYADPTKDLDFVIREARLQDQKNRQASIETSDLALKDWWEEQQSELKEKAKSIYAAAIAKGIAKEQARAVLPEGMTESKIYMAGSIRSWIHYIQIRTEVATQKEHREVAIACAKRSEERRVGERV